VAVPSGKNRSDVASLVSVGNRSACGPLTNSFMISVTFASETLTGATLATTVLSLYPSGAGGGRRCLFRGGADFFRGRVIHPYGLAR